jgi:murein DD-endopeptidase MepM/ murein hydrolase activator NlpD
MVRLAPYAAAASAALILWHAARDTSSSVAFAPAPLVYPHASAAGAVPTAPAMAAIKAGTLPTAAVQAGPPALAQQANLAATFEVVVGRNDTLDGIFRRMALDISDLAAIRHLPGIRQSLDFLKPGDAIKVTHADGAIKELTHKVSETQTLKVVREDAGFAAKMIDNPVETRIRTAGATIDSSLFQAAEAADISDIVALKLANVFAWDIDFVLDIREGDRFTVVYEQIYQDGKYLRDGEVLAAEFVNSGKVYRAVRFVTEAGTASYYTPDGLAMRKAFLRAPVEFTRVSSVFNPHRMHPILNRIRGHMGTDYAAPMGTPVHAAGDGHVSFAGQRGGYGNAVVLAHSNSVSTLYGHMSRFAKHIRVGTPIQQGEVIGYVGMTGLATGPHLHYEYLVNGVHKDPQTVHLPGAEPLRAQELQKFRELTAPLLADLSPQRAAPVAAAAGTAAPSVSAGPAIAAVAGAVSVAAPFAAPLANEPAPSSVFSVSSVLNDSRFSLGDEPSRTAVN